MKPLFSYTDYRRYITDWLDQRRAKKLPVSNRWFANVLGIRSSSWLTAVLQGKKGVSEETAGKMSMVCGHTLLESSYFSTLVRFNQAKTIEARNKYYRELGDFRKRKNLQVVVSDQYEYYAVWYHSVVRSIIGMYGFRDDFSWLACMVSPPITAVQARKSVMLLDRLGIIGKNGDGCYTLTSTHISTGEHEKSLAIANYQHETMRLAQEALDRYEKERRDISTLTLGLSERSYHAIKTLLDETKRKIQSIVTEDLDSDRVYQLNLQFFPVSNLARLEGKKT